MIHAVKGFSLSQWSRSRCFSGILLLFLWSDGCWQLDLWFSAFSKLSLNIWKFSVHILLKLSLKDFEHYFARMWNECNCAVVWTFFVIASLWDWNENCDHCWVFPICWHVECNTFIASSFRIWNSSTGIPSPPLLLLLLLSHFSRVRLCATS